MKLALSDTANDIRPIYATLNGVNFYGMRAFNSARLLNINASLINFSAMASSQTFRLLNINVGLFNFGYTGISDGASLVNINAYLFDFSNAPSGFSFGKYNYSCTLSNGCS